MRISVLVVINPVGDHALRRQIVSDEFLNQGDVLDPRQFFRQRDDELTGKLRVGPRLERIHRVPQRLACRGDAFALDGRAEPGGYLIRQRQLFMLQFASTAAIAEGGSGLFVHHPGAVTISGGRDDASPCSPADHLRSDEHDRH